MQAPDRIRERLRSALAAVALAALPVWLARAHWRARWPWSGDAVSQVLPTAIARRELAAGRLPLSSSLYFQGESLLNPHSQLLYPPWWVTLSPLPLADALKLVLAAHFAAAPLVAYWYARRADLPVPVAAGIGAAAAMPLAGLSGHHQKVLGWPWLLLLAGQLLPWEWDRARRSGALVGLSGGALLLASSLYYAFYAAVLVAPLFLLYRERERWSAAVAGAAVGLPALALNVLPYLGAPRPTPGWWLTPWTVLTGLVGVAPGDPWRVEGYLVTGVPFEGYAVVGAGVVLLGLVGLALGLEGAGADGNGEGDGDGDRGGDGHGEGDGNGDRGGDGGGDGVTAGSTTPPADAPGVLDPVLPGEGVDPRRPAADRLRWAKGVTAGGVLGLTLTILPLPYLLPVVSAFRTAGRANVTVALATLVFAVYACRRILDRSGDPVERSGVDGGDPVERTPGRAPDRGRDPTTDRRVRVASVALAVLLVANAWTGVVAWRAMDAGTGTDLAASTAFAADLPACGDEVWTEMYAGDGAIPRGHLGMALLRAGYTLDAVYYAAVGASYDLRDPDGSLTFDLLIAPTRLEGTTPLTGGSAQVVRGRVDRAELTYLGPREYRGERVHLYAPRGAC